MRNQEQDKMLLGLLQDDKPITFNDDFARSVFKQDNKRLDVFYPRHNQPLSSRSKNRMFQSDETLHYKGKELSISDLERELEKILGVSNVTIIK